MEHQLELSTEDLWEEISGRLKEALSDIEAVKDETVEGKVEADLKAALAAIPEPKGDDDDPGHGRRK